MVLDYEDVHFLLINQNRFKMEIWVLIERELALIAAKKIKYICLRSRLASVNTHNGEVLIRYSINYIALTVVFGVCKAEDIMNEFAFILMMYPLKIPVLSFFILGQKILNDFGQASKL